MNKSIFILAVLFSCMFISCSSDDDNNEDSYSSVTVEELEKQPSFEYQGANTVIIWFRGGKLNVYNDAKIKSSSLLLTYNYTLNDRTITLTKGDETYKGFIMSYTLNSKKKLGLFTTYNGEIGDLPQDIVHHYDYSNLRLDK